MAEITITGGIAAATVADAAAGDRDALARIVGAHHDDMARICFVICGDQDLAQDAVQAAWPVAWRKLDTLRDSDRLRPWLMAVAANEARQMLRRRQRHRIVEIDVADISSERLDPAAGTSLIDLAAALRRLPPDDRALLALRYVAGFDAGEIASSARHVCLGRPKPPVPPDPAPANGARRCLRRRSRRSSRPSCVPTPKRGVRPVDPRDRDARCPLAPEASRAFSAPLAAPPWSAPPSRARRADCRLAHVRPAASASPGRGPSTPARCPDHVGCRRVLGRGRSPTPGLPSP